MAGYAIAIIVSILVLVTIWDNVTGEKLFDQISSFMTGIAVAIAPFIYFVKAKQKENSERRRASKNLYAEIDKTQNALDEKAHQNNFKMVEYKGGEKYFFINRMLNHDFYDSLIFSGKISFLTSTLQQHTQDVFQMIRDHNLFIKNIRKIEDDADLDEDISLKTKRYYEALHKIEIDLLKENNIPSLKQRLEKEFKMF